MSPEAAPVTDPAALAAAPDLAGVVPVAWRRYVDVDALHGVERWLGAEVAAGRGIQPARASVFRALDLVAPEDVRVVVCGQDPYPTPGVPIGLAFAVAPDAAVPASLRNMYAELRDDLGIEPATTGDLTPWAEAGMLLLNASLTVRPGASASHAGAGWPAVTRTLLERLAAERDGIVFLALGRHAQNVVERLPLDGHRVVTAAHPSPMSVRAFSGSRPFSRVDAALAELGHEPFRWSLA